MSVNRLSIPALNKIIAGEIKEDATCIVKFYSNGCNMCHNLKGYYEDISEIEDYNDVHFFAFNVDDYPQIEKQLNFDGVPTISLIKTSVSDRKPKIRILRDPEKPNEHTWYSVRDIRNFIKEEK